MLNNGYESTTEDKRVISKWKFYEREQIISRLRVKEIRQRILAEATAEKTKIEGARVVEQEEEEKEKSDWKAGLPINVVEACIEYTRMVNKLKYKVFINYLELDTFIHQMEEKRNIVKIHAPQLLNQEKSEYIDRAKVLEFYSPNVDTHSKLYRIDDALLDYSTVFNFFKEAELARNKTDKTVYNSKYEVYINELQNKNPAAYMLIQTRLKNVKRELNRSLRPQKIKILKKESENINHAQKIVQHYKDLSQSLGLYNEEIDEKSKIVLFALEEALQNKMQEFFKYYKYEHRNNVLNL